jgi:diguanylate cyclase (GGDEF)-like protein
VGLALLPAVLLGLLVPFLVVPVDAPPNHSKYQMLLISGGLVISIYALTLVVIVLRSTQKAKDLSEDRNILKRRNRSLDGHVRALESEVELLTAMREVSRITSDEVRFEKLVGSVLQVVSDLTEAREVTLFLLDPATKKLVPRAEYSGEKIRVAQKLTGVRLDPSEAESALEHAGILRTVEMDILDVIVPLLADQQPLGVLHITVELEGDADAKADRADNVEFVLADISRHVSLAIKTAALHARAVHDGPTGLFNKEHFLATLAESVADARRNQAPLSLIMLDIDHFKVINDTFGHPTGDQVLAQLAKLLASNLRRSDSAYRYGGEEIAILLPGAPGAVAASLAERLRVKVETKKFRGVGGESIDATVSLGVAELNDDMENPAALVTASDSALYAAKKGGRNQVRSAEPA